MPWNKGIPRSEETKRKIRRALKGRKPKNLELLLSLPRKGIKGDKNPAKRPEVRAKLSKAAKGRKHSEETKQKMSETRKKNPTNYWQGKKRSEETKEKIRISKLLNPTRYWSGKKRRPQTMEKIAAKKRRRRNPKHSKFLIAFYKENPEKHPNYIMAHAKEGKGYISKNQRELSNFLKTLFPDAMLEYPIKTPNGIRFADVGIPSIRVDFEYDGTYWHRNKDDKKRDSELNCVGWETYRILEGNKNWEEEIKSYLVELAVL